MDLLNIELSKPYNDWTGLRELGNELDHDAGIYYRYQACFNLIADEEDESEEYKEINITPLKDTRFLTLTEVRKLVSIAFAKKMTESFPKGGLLVAENTGLNNTQISKMIMYARAAAPLEERKLKNGEIRLPCPYPPENAGITAQEKPYSAPLNTVFPTADYVMGTSVHSMFFGEEGKIVLPGKYSLIAEKLRCLDGTTKDGLLQFARTLRDKDMRVIKEKYARYNQPDVSDYGQTKLANELIYERLNELAQDNPFSLNPKFLLNTTTGGSNKIKTKLKTISSTENKNSPPVTVKDEETGKTIQAAYLPNIEFIMFLAMEMPDVSMDYFIANDFINVEGGYRDNGRNRNLTPVYMKKANGETQEISDIKDLQLLSFCLGLREETKSEFIGRLGSQIFAADIS